MNYDALMRWEWEGGAPIPVSQLVESRGATRADNAPVRPPPNTSESTRQVATVMPVRSNGSRGDAGSDV
jgi:hypothetical protein